MIIDNNSKTAVSPKNTERNWIFLLSYWN